MRDGAPRHGSDTRTELGKLGARVDPENEGDLSMAQGTTLIQPLAEGRDHETEKEARLADQIAEGAPD